MRTKSNPSLLYILICLSLLSGCAGFGKITSPRGEDVTVDRLISDFERYHVYYMESYHRCSPVLVFDPKDDERTLRSDDWEEVGSPEDLADYLHRVRRSGAADVYLLLGPDDRRFGYLVATGTYRIYSQAAGEGTLELRTRSTPCYGVGP